MKKSIVVSIVFAIVLFSCKNERPTEIQPKGIIVNQSILKECYRAIIKKDTIILNLNIKGDQILSGKLTYAFFEKDRNEGKIIGKIKDDTLFADYTFISEGVTSIRQVAFLKKNNTFVEGFAELVDDKKGKATFKNTKKLDFSGKTILLKVDCKM